MGGAVRRLAIRPSTAKLSQKGPEINQLWVLAGSLAQSRDSWRLPRRTRLARSARTHACVRGLVVLLITSGIWTLSQRDW